jgi:hypothetical protein
MRSCCAGLAEKRQVIAAYNQLIGANRQTFSKKAATAANICRQDGNTLPHMDFGECPGANESANARML